MNALKSSFDINNIFTENTVKWFNNALGEPTAVQKEAWPAIAGGKHILVSAPTGTGKTLSAFLVFIDRLTSLARENKLKKQLYVIYVSPLKSLAGDIRENLKRPLDGISMQEPLDVTDYRPSVSVAVRTGDTPQSERRRMLKSPPHILIITPESLYLMLTSVSGQSILKTAEAIIIDELHALIDSKRGAHLMLSAARLDRLCPAPLQRIGLSATIEPLDRAAEYLSPDGAVIAAPQTEKKIRIEVINPYSESAVMKPTIWEDIAYTVYKYCKNVFSLKDGNGTAIAFVDGRAYAEKLAYHVNLVAGDSFAQTHHGSLSKEHRLGVEKALREGELRLLCATSSMELGIDVGDIDVVFQIGCPYTISGTMQRLGRAGHSPGRESVMYMFPRTASEGLFCGITAEIAGDGGVEHCKPPLLCFDVLAQHLVSMATGGGYHVSDIMEILPRAYPFKDVSENDILDILGMLAGDYEHNRDIPVRPRILYDRINNKVEGDAYSRMLAVSAGGTIPDRGAYAAKTESGVKIGELEEEFVYETKIGDKFILGTFAWRIASIQKDSVIVQQTSSAGARLPFWKGEPKGRSLQTGIAFGKILRRLNEAHMLQQLNPVNPALSKSSLHEGDLLFGELSRLGLDESAAKNAEEFIKRQFISTGMLPDDKTIIIEHFKDSSGDCHMMVHSIFGRQVNAPLSILLNEIAVKATGYNIGFVDEDNGFLLFPYGGDFLPEGLLQRINPKTAAEVLIALIPTTPLFNITFRHNINHALMMGVKQRGRLPLWLQRLRSAETLEAIVRYENHPLIRETKRECLDDYWDLAGVEYILNSIQSGAIQIRELYLDSASPMSLPLQWKTEAAVMYDYSPTPRGAHYVAEKALEQTELLKPSPEKLAELNGISSSQPKDEKQLHSMLMIEGDITVTELNILNIPLEWLETLLQSGRIKYIEPGLWIAAEHEKDYGGIIENAVNINVSDAVNISGINPETVLPIVRRLLRYKGAKTETQIKERYSLSEDIVSEAVLQLCGKENVIKDGELYYHAELYNRARRETVKSRREIRTLPPQNYAALLASRVFNQVSPDADVQLERTLKPLCNQPFPAVLWESVILPARAEKYSPAALDRLLAAGSVFWKLLPENNLCFYQYDDIDWDYDLTENAADFPSDEKIVYEALLKRGASFLKGLSSLLGGAAPYDALLELAGKGLVCADSFLPVRNWLEKDKPISLSVNQRVNSRVRLSAGRWEAVRPIKAIGAKEKLLQLFESNIILSRETVNGISWYEALETLRIMEYTGEVRRGYFIEGLSGAQFILDKEFASVMAALEQPQDRIVWLSGADPAQQWGKTLRHNPNKTFINVAGTAVALKAGVPVMVFERFGKSMRIFGAEHLSEALDAFIFAYSLKRIFPLTARITVKEYPPEAEEALKRVGFSKQMMDYVLYKK